jgi:hypothetical protein
LTQSESIVCPHASSLAEFLSQIALLGKSWLAYWNEKSKREDEQDIATAWVAWFRGEVNADSPTVLQPKLYRADARLTNRTLLRHEQELRADFRRRGAQLLGDIRRPLDHWDWYFLMQHYGVPTRLLDWTDSALVALHFAVKGDASSQGQQKEPDAAVYALDPWWLNDQAFTEVSLVNEVYRSRGPAEPEWEEAKHYLSVDPYQNDELGVRTPLAVDPSHFSRRIAAQRSRFTVFGTEPAGLKSLMNKESAHLRCIRITSEALPNVRDELRICGITESTIFPDLEGLGRELFDWFQRSLKTIP